MNKRDLKDGMIVRTRGIKDEYYEFYILNSKFYSKASVIEEASLEMSDFNDDLTHKEYKNYDIMKVFYDNKEIWERPLDWAKVAFGTEVVAYDDLITNRVVGKLLKYDNRAECYKFFVYYENEFGAPQAGFFKQCALLKDIEPEEPEVAKPVKPVNYKYDKEFKMVKARCPICGTLVVSAEPNEKDDQCPNCKVELDWTDIWDKATEKHDPVKPVIIESEDGCRIECPICKTRIKDDGIDRDEVCPECGVKIKW